MGGARPQQSRQLCGVAALAVPVEAMEAADVEGDVEGTAQRLQMRDVGDDEARLDGVRGGGGARLADGRPTPQPSSSTRAGGGEPARMTALSSAGMRTSPQKVTGAR
jgi:hypothetical protein